MENISLKIFLAVGQCHFNVLKRYWNGYNVPGTFIRPSEALFQN